MTKLVLKDPVIGTSERPSKTSEGPDPSRAPKDPSRALNKTTQTDIQYTQTSLALGISSAIMMMVLFIYIYVTASKNNNGNLKWVNIDTKHSYTMSEAFQYCDHKGSTVLMIIALSLMQGFLTSLHFNIPDPARLTVVASVYITIIGWILLFYIFVSEKVNHGLVSFLVCFTMIFDSVMIRSIYLDIYEEEGLEYLSGICYTVIALYVCLLLSFILNGITCNFFPGTLKFRLLSIHLVGIFEILCIIMFIAFLFCLATLPPLPDMTKVCYYESSL
jgi:hypothetical protein